MAAILPSHHEPDTCGSAGFLVVEGHSHIAAAQLPPPHLRRIAASASFGLGLGLESYAHFG